MWSTTMMLDKTKHVAYIPELPGPLVDKIGNFISFVLVCLHELLTVEMVGREEPHAGGNFPANMYQRHW